MRVQWIGVGQAVRIASLLLIAASAWAQPVPSSAVVIQTTHSTIYGSVVASEAPYAMRVRYGETISYEAGAGGGIQGQYTAIHYPTDGLYRWAIAGLKANTLTYGCVQLSADAVTWSACATFTSTTSALPAVHPAPPIAATEVDTARADWSTWTHFDVDPDCGNFAAQISAAESNRSSGNNSLVIVPGTGVTCPTITAPATSQWVAVTGNATTNEFAKAGHGYSSNQKLRVATSLNYTYMPGGLYMGNDYYVISVDADHFKLSYTAGPGAEVDITSAGTSVYVLPWPPSSVPWIYIVNSKVLDGTFLPSGVRVSSAWDAAMPVIYSTGSGANGTTPAIQFPDMATNWRFIGVKVATPDTATAELAATNTTDITGSWYIINGIVRSAGGIIFDQCRFVAAPWPNRMAIFFTHFDGENNAIIDSDFENMVWWQGYSNILGSKTNSTTVKLTAGAYYAGLFTLTLPTDVTITITGGSNTCAWDATTLDGCFIVYATKDAVLHAVFPTGMSATCTGYASCSVDVVASPALPMSGGKVQAVYLMVGKLASGAFDEIFGIDMNNNQFGSQNEYQAPGRLGTKTSGEGAAAVVCGGGPGPFTFRNNRLDGVGLPLYCDDTAQYGGGLYNYQRKGDTVVRRNLFTTDWNTRLDGSRGAAGHRNMVESKGDERFLLKGNIIENCYGELHRSSDIQFTALATKMTDIDIVSNVQRNCGHNGPWPGVYASIGQPLAYPMSRVRLRNNLFYGNDVITQRVAWRPSQGTAGAGLAHHLQGQQSEDYIIQHNTYWDFRGGDPSFIRRNNGVMEGPRIVDNFIMVSNTDLIKKEGDDFGAGYNQTTCSGTSKQQADCWYVAGIGNPDLTFRGNVLMPGWADTSVPSGVIDLSAFCTSLGGSWSTPNCIGGLATGNKMVIGSTVADRATNSGLVGTGQIIDFTMKYAGTFRGKDVPTTDGLDPGVDVVQLKADLGLVDAPRALGITDTAATIAVTVHDGATGASCIVGYGTATTPPSWSRSSADTTASRFRSIGLTGLSSGTTYNYQVWCNGMAVTATAQFQTR